jgi:arylformamidase
VAGWAARSDTLRKARHGAIDVQYGEMPRQRLDVFACGQPSAPTLVFIHGGYWQMNDKEPYAFLGEGVLAAGFNLALVEYTLAPAARLDRIVAEIRAAVAWVIDHAREFGGEPGRVFVSGHSAGGHLTAMAMDDERVAGGIAISGIYDLEPIRLNYLNDKLGLDAAEAARNSPILHLPSHAAPLVVTVGLGELPELIRQSEEYSRARQRHRLAGEYLPLAGHDHFSILEDHFRDRPPMKACIERMKADPASRRCIEDRYLGPELDPRRAGRLPPGLARLHVREGHEASRVHSSFLRRPAEHRRGNRLRVASHQRAASHASGAR